jgi:hypothetical protein
MFPVKRKGKRNPLKLFILQKRFHHNQEKPLSDSLPFVVTLKVRAQVAYSAKSKVLSPKLNDVRISSGDFTDHKTRSQREICAFSI